MSLSRTRIFEWLLVGLVAALTAGLPVSGAAQATGVPQPAFVPDEVIITYREGASVDAITLLEARYKLTLKRAFPEIRARHYQLPAGTDVKATIESLSQENIVEAAEPNIYLRLNAIPTDPRFAEQWALLNTGQTVNGVTSTAGVDIRWTQAMDAFTGTSPIIVAVVDSGVALDHPELNPNRWLNPAETLNGIDDNGNGLVDDVLGWDFFANDNLPLDEYGHGSLVASLIGAAAGNGEGGVGVAQNVKLMALRVGNNVGAITADAAVQAFLYAASNGARIVNFSAGGLFNPFMMNAIRFLDATGVLFVAAAGNGGSDGIGDDNDGTQPTYPASYGLPNIVSVAAVDQKGGLASFSNFGPASVHLAAPGTNMFGADVKRVLTFVETFETGAPGWTTLQLPGSASTLPWAIVVSGLNHYATDSVDFLGNQINYLPNTDSVLVSPPISLGVGSQLQFIAAIALASGDCAGIEISPDGGATWNLATSPVCGPLAVATALAVDLSPYDLGTVRIRFRLRTDANLNADGLRIDDVTINNVGVFNYDGTQYRFNDGTSFSAPLVSGVAALLMSQRPDLSHRRIKQLIIDNANKIPALSGKVLSGGMLDANAAVLAAKAAPPPPPPTIVFSAVLPASRSVPVGGTATAFATIINAGATPAEGCTVTPADPLPGKFVFQTTNPATNALTGSPNTPINIAPGAAQSFVFAFTPLAAFNPSEFKLDFSCFNAPAAGVTVGLNTLLVSASTTPVPDVVALAATLTGDGIVNIPGASGAGAFAVASVNVGAGGAITVAADTGGATLPVNLTLCETNPGTGQCLQPPAGSVATTIASGATPTFAIFARGTGSVVPFDPAGNRVFVRFRDAGGTVRGATSVAVRTR